VNTQIDSADMYSLRFAYLSPIHWLETGG